ncbi:MAG: hypothetical protein A2287_03995 [Candidatus Melainabacteria bacterium RIFOXYA12_FULL_32_12]|nr:MAG: hypothetical protein A2255_07845 [Candidatus Melainabacteria bacterium RIFOXYA2_FULL_32_9]OGI31639.1 MAG: hypothetical protein A2287_03995 [Candidatus Melainabacteria bacterium RIFOXYA12_FULL_32_12]
MNKFKLFLSFLIISFLMIILPSYGQNTGKESMPLKLEYAVGKIQEISSEKENKLLHETLGGIQTTQTVKVKIISGKHKGETVETQNQLTSNPAYDIKIKPGSRVILEIEEKGDKSDFYISDLERAPALMIILGLFLTLILTVSGIKGLRTLFSLGITAFLVFFVLIPAILSNYPIIPTTIAIALISTLVTMFVIGGINIKSLSATLGTVGGLSVAGLLSMLIIKIAPLTGLTDQESVILWTSRPDLDFTGILTAAMIIGSLGAIMDVGISIASSITEVKETNPLLSPTQLIKSGLNVGTDIIGAMSNTLILAYIGGAFPLILLAANVPFIKFINLNSIASEIAAAIAGSIGIVLCVPITAAISGYLIGRQATLKNQIIKEDLTDNIFNK